MKDFDHKKFRKNLADDIRKEPDHKKRPRILRGEEKTTRYGIAKQKHLVDRGRKSKLNK